MRVVLDTNVVVQALLSAPGPSGIIFGFAMLRTIELLVDERLMEEYADVLGRPEFGFRRVEVKKVLERIVRVAQPINAHGLPGGTKGFPDPDDAMVLEVAVSGKAEVLVTNNVRHFPASLRCRVLVLTPLEFVERFIHVGEEPQ